MTLSASVVEFESKVYALHVKHDALAANLRTLAAELDPTIKAAYNRCMYCNNPYGWPGQEAKDCSRHLWCSSCHVEGVGFECAHATRGPPTNKHGFRVFNCGVSWGKCYKCRTAAKTD